MNKRKILVVTGTRADYGLLRWIMEEIKASEKLELQVIATMMHLSPEFGLTYQEIERDGFRIDEKLETLLASDSAISSAKSVSLGVTGFAEAFERLSPDIVFLLGDRVEMLSAAIAATLTQTPIAHIHGGETTEGLIDEAIRHSITKMAQIHFTSTKKHLRRVIQMGEQPDKVINVGAPGLEILQRDKLLTLPELETSLDFKFNEQTFLITYHPVTLESRPEEEAFAKLLDALKTFPSAKFIITYPNSDTHGRKIINLLENFAADNPDRVYITKSLGQKRYLSTAKHCSAVIGNSSSALIEIPSLRIASINIGRRQQGRTAPESVIHCSEETLDIIQAIKIATSSEFQDKLQSIDTLYGDGKVASKVVKFLEKVKLQNILFKSFHEVG
ncbi:UDP-N-acetylglucosamine 2-epimerase [Kiloniella litopenaei]|uniref:UDP-N-acetylglucosamine 2-epimerase n=1 Tax=Kiloniella litopenaei TaxID=1549748 RepID=UPI003BAA8934